MVVNVGSGESVTVSEIANRLARVLGCEHIASGITGKYRVGDVRHCFADTSLAERTLGYRSTVSLEEGILRLAGWLEGQVAHDRVDNATAELAERGLTL